MKRLLLPMLLCALPAFGQGTRVDVQAQFSNAGVVNVIPNAPVSVCTAASTGIPCSPTTTVYSDVALTSPITQPFTADAQGNIGFYVPTGGTYRWTINPNSSAPAGAGPFTITPACSPSGTCVFSGTGTFGSLNGDIVLDGVKYATFQAALNAVTTPGQQIRIPPGTYTISSNPSWPFIPINLQCADKNDTILSFTAASGQAITPWYGSRIAHCDLRGNGTGSLSGIAGGATAWVALTAYTTANIAITPTFLNMNGHIYKETVASCTSGASEPTPWPIVPGATGPADGTCQWQEENTQGLEIYDNIIENFCGAQIINTGGFSYGWKVHHNIIRNGCSANQSEGILIGSDSRNNEVSENEFDDIPGNAIDINGSWNVVRGNIMSRIGGTGGAFDHAGIYLFPVATFHDIADNVVEDNVMTNVGTNCVRLDGLTAQGVRRNLISGNRCNTVSSTSSNGDCYSVLGRSAGTIFDQNQFIGNSCITAQRYGIQINSNAGADTITNTQVEANTISGSGTFDILTNTTTHTSLIGNSFLTTGKESSFTGDVDGPLFRGNIVTTAPAISPASGFNTGGISSSAGYESFVTFTGSGTANSTGTINLGWNVAGWNCKATNQSRAAVILQTGNTASTVTFTNFGTGFSATNWSNGDNLFIMCEPL